MGISDERLAPIPVPDGFGYLLEHFLKLRTGESLTYLEMQAYCSMTGVFLSPLEIDAIMHLDKVANSVIDAVLKEGENDGGTE